MPEAFIPAKTKVKLRGTIPNKILVTDKIGLVMRYPTLEEIIEKAIEINKFVSDNTERELGRVVKRASGIGIVF